MALRPRVFKCMKGCAVYQIDRNRDVERRRVVVLDRRRVVLDRRRVVLVRRPVVLGRRRVVLVRRRVERRELV